MANRQDGRRTPIERPSAEALADAQVSTLQDAHYELIEAYVRILREVERLPAVLVEVPGELAPARRQRGLFRLLRPLLSPWRPLIRLGVHAHIKRILVGLRRGYLIEGQRRKYRANGSEWVDEAADGCLAITSALGRPRLRVLAVTLGPVLLGAMLAAIDVSDLFNAGAARARGLGTWGLIAVSASWLPTFCLIVPFASSFGVKRSLLYPGVEVDEAIDTAAARLRYEQAGTDVPTGQNVYELENDLFKEMKLRKPLEMRVDLWLEALFFMVIVVGLGIGAPMGLNIYLGKLEEPPPTWVSIAVGVGVAVILFVMLLRSVWLKDLRRRRWR